MLLWLLQFQLNLKITWGGGGGGGGGVPVFPSPVCNPAVDCCSSKKAKAIHMYSHSHASFCHIILMDTEALRQSWHCSTGKEEGLA